MCGCGIVHLGGVQETLAGLRVPDHLREGSTFLGTSPERFEIRDIVHGLTFQHRRNGSAAFRVREAGRRGLIQVKGRQPSDRRHLRRRKACRAGCILRPGRGSNRSRRGLCLRTVTPIHATSTKAGWYICA
jgi:hypothetical protein